MARIVKFAVVLPIMIYCILSIFFMIFVVINPFKSRREFFDNMIGLPKEFTFEHIISAWVDGKFSLYFLNSILITTTTVLFFLMIASLTAYGIARYSFAGNRLMYLYFLIGLMLPANLFVIPLYLQLRNIGLTNTLTGLIIVYIATMISFGIFILTGFFRTLPTEIHEAAKLDGAGEATVFWKIMMPLARPVLGALGIIASISVWNEFFFSLVFVQDQLKKPLPLAMQYFYEANKQNWPLIFAALFIVTLPMVVIYFIGSKQIIRGLTSGAVK